MITNGLKNTQQNLAFLNSQIGIVKHCQNITLKLGTEFKKEHVTHNIWWKPYYLFVIIYLFVLTFICI